MTWAFTPARIGTVGFTILPHQGRIAVNGVDLDVANYSNLTQTTSAKINQIISHTFSDIGEAQIRQAEVGAVLTTVLLPAIVPTEPFAEDAGRTRASAFIRLSDTHEARLRVKLRNEEYDNGSLLPIIGHNQTLFNRRSYEYLVLELLVDGTTVEERIISSLDVGQTAGNSGVESRHRFHAWYVLDEESQLHFCCGAFGANRFRLPISSYNDGKLFPTPTFGAGTCILSTPVDMEEAFIGGCRFGTFCEHSTFTSSNGGQFFVAARTGFMTAARNATPDSPATIAARAGSGLASLRQELTNLVQPLTESSNDPGTVFGGSQTYGQGIISIDNGGQPEYPSGQIGQFVAASHSYKKGHIGFLRPGVSNVGETVEQNQRLATLRISITGAAPYDLEGRYVDCSCDHGFNEYQGASTYEAEVNSVVQQIAFNAYATLHRADRVVPNDAAAFSDVTISSDFYLTVTIWAGFALVGANVPPAATAVPEFRTFNRQLTEAEAALLLAGDPVGPMSPGLIVQAVGPVA